MKKILNFVGPLSVVFLLLFSSFVFADFEKINVPDVIDPKYVDEYVKQVQLDLDNPSLTEKERDDREREYISKFKKVDKKKQAKGDEEMRKVLDKAFEEKQKLERKKERKTGEIINKYFSDVNYEELAVSIEKKDKIAVMYRAVELLENDSISDSEASYLKYYLFKFSPYAGDKYLEMKADEIEKDENLIVPLQNTSDYDRIAADNYADNHVYNYNIPTYPDLNLLGGDCANFVSQSLHAGGINMDTVWYIDAKQNPPRYTRPTSVDQLNYSWDLADPSPWISAEEFNNYWDGEAEEYFDYTPSEVEANHESIYADLWRGDVIQIMKKTWLWYEGYHTMIVSNYINGDLAMSYHTDDVQDKPLLDIVETYNTDTWHFDFFEIKSDF